MFVNFGKADRRSGLQANKDTFDLKSACLSIYVMWIANSIILIKYDRSSVHGVGKPA